jgi:hypothetical protein
MIGKKFSLFHTYRFLLRFLALTRCTAAEKDQHLSPTKLNIFISGWQLEWKYSQVIFCFSGKLPVSINVIHSSILGLFALLLINFPHHQL